MSHPITADSKHFGDTALGHGLAWSAVIISLFLGFSILLRTAGWLDSNVGKKGGSMLTWGGTDASTFSNGTPDNSHATQGEKQSWSGVQKLKPDAIAGHAQAGLPGDAKNEKPVSEENRHATN